MVLENFIVANREAILTRCRQKVGTRSGLIPIGHESDYGIPRFLDELVEELRRRPNLDVNLNIGETALHYGHDLLVTGFSPAQVVHAYGDVCQAITELAVETDASISAADFRTLNRCLDEAIASAVTEYGRERGQVSADILTDQGNERVGFLAHELRNLLNTAIVAFDVLKTGNVGVAGSTGNVLHRSLLGLRSLVSRSLAEVRLTQGVQRREPILVSRFIDDIGAAANLEAHANGLKLTVFPVDDDVFVEGDRQVIGAVLGNLLQNAFKFTHRNTTVTLRVRASAERVLMEIEDECGGLAPGNTDDLFRPFEQRSTDRTGLGLGLAFSRWGVEATHGRIYARNLPGQGCVFTVDLPRMPAPAVAAAQLHRADGLLSRGAAM